MHKGMRGWGPPAQWGGFSGLTLLLLLLGSPALTLGLWADMWCAVSGLACIQAEKLLCGLCGDGGMWINLPLVSLSEKSRLRRAVLLVAGEDQSLGHLPLSLSCSFTSRGTWAGL